MKQLYSLLTKRLIAVMGIFVLTVYSFSEIKAQTTVLTYSYTGTIQQFTVPSCVSTITMEAWGAQGGSIPSYPGGLGAYMSGVFTVSQGQVLRVIVGGQGGDLSTTPSATGGGGGSFVALINGTNTPVPWIAAGGGGGRRNITTGAAANSHGVTSIAAQLSAGTSGAAGNNGNGGQSGEPNGAGTGGPGGGFYTNGGPSGTAGGTPGFAFVNGGAQAPTCSPFTSGTASFGGFGGGGAGCWCYRGTPGGGGGYSGGASGVNDNAGGGGGSYNVGTSQNNTAATRSGHGQVRFTYNFLGNGIAAGASTSSVCIGASPTLTASGMVSYTWNPGGSNSTSIVVTPSVTTSYTASGTNTLNCVSLSIITITVDPAVPNLSVINTATASSGICPGNTVAITASGATTYTWTGGISNGVPFTPTTATNYVVTGGNACGTSTAATSVSVHPLPPIVASISQPSVCTGNTVVTLATGATSYTWSHGVPNGQFLYPSSTTMYSVTGTSALGCTATAMVGVTVEVTPILAPVATPTVICIGGSGTIAAQGAAVYNWMPGNLNTGTIVITPTITTTFTLTKSNSNCVDVKTITVFVNQLPNVFAITSNTVVCAGSSATLSGGGASSYSWTPSPFNLVGNNVSVSPSAPTVYTCTGTDGTCTATYTVFVNTNPIPTIQPVASTGTLCAGGSVTLSATGALTYTWNPGGITGSQIVTTPGGPTNYIVSGTNIFTCSSQAQIPVIVYPNPTVNAIPNKTLVCLNGPSTITASGANTYVWSTGALTHTTLVFPPATTVYTVTGTYTNSGCSSSKTVMVQAYTPVTGINGPTAVCIGSSITISSAPANSYTWSSGGNFISNQASIFIGPNINTTYLLGTTSTSNQVSCVGGNSITIQVNPLPIVTASAVANRTLICRFESVDLFANGGLTYSWVNQGSNTSMLTVSPLTQTTYTVLGTDANGCVNSATVTIKISICQGLEELNNTAGGISIFPNPSSGEFKISTNQNMSLLLVNDLGQIIREIDLNESNAYTASIKGIAQGVYFLSAKNKQDQINKKIIIE